MRTVRKPGPPRLRRFPAAKQRCMDALLEKNSEGTITEKDKAKLEALVAEAQNVIVANARRLAAFARAGEPGAPPEAVPVTIWLHPQRGEG